MQIKNFIERKKYYLAFFDKVPLLCQILSQKHINCDFCTFFRYVNQLYIFQFSQFSVALSNSDLHGKICSKTSKIEGIVAILVNRPTKQCFSPSCWLKMGKLDSEMGENDTLLHYLNFICVTHGQVQYLLNFYRRKSYD